MGWMSSYGKCNNCDYRGAMYSSGCPICGSKDLNGDGYDFGEEISRFVVMLILIITIAVIFGCKS